MSRCDRCGGNFTAEAYKQHKHNAALCHPDAAFCFARDKIADTLAMMFWGKPEPPHMRPNLSDPQIDAIARHVRAYGNSDAELLKTVGEAVKRFAIKEARIFTLETAAQVVVEKQKRRATRSTRTKEEDERLVRELYDAIDALAATLRNVDAVGASEGGAK